MNAWNPSALQCRRMAEGSALVHEEFKELEGVEYITLSAIVSRNCC